MATRSNTARRRSEHRSQGPGTDRSGSATGWLKLVTAGVVGTALLARGLRRRSLRGWLQALVGGWLLVRTGRGAVRAARRRPARIGTEERTDRSGTDAWTVSRTITVDASAEDVYEYWRDPDDFSRIVGRVADVTALGDDRLRWSVDGPGGRQLTWETRIVEAEPGESLRWVTTEDARIGHEGSVTFRPADGDRGTAVTFTLKADPPGGALGRAALSRLDLLPETLVGEALSRSKSLVETGEIATLEDNPSARGRGDLL